MVLEKKSTEGMCICVNAIGCKEEWYQIYMQIWKLDKKDKGKKVALRIGVFTLKLKLSWLYFSRDSFIKATHPYERKHRDTRTERLWVTVTDTVTQSGRCRLPFLVALRFLGNWLGFTDTKPVYCFVHWYPN